MLLVAILRVMLKCFQLANALRAGAELQSQKDQLLRTLEIKDQDSASLLKKLQDQARRGWGADRDRI